jgi:hypothetical protein
MTTKRCTIYVKNDAIVIKINETKILEVLIKLCIVITTTIPVINVKMIKKNGLGKVNIFLEIIPNITRVAIPVRQNDIERETDVDM